MTRPPTEMEMRVAKAMANESAPWINCLSDEQALALTRVAIRAMREPTRLMVKNGSFELIGYNPDFDAKSDYVPDVWQAMIDAASPPQTE